MGYFSRRVDSWASPNLGSSLEVVAYGGYGKPLLLFPSLASGHQFEELGLIDVLEPAIDAGRLKVYAVEALDGPGWPNPEAPAAERIRQQDRFDRAIAEEVVPYIRHDCRSAGLRLATAGFAFGAFHAFNSLCRHPDLFDEVTALSGIFDLDPYMEGAPADEVYWHNPMAFLPNLDDHYFLPMLRSQCALRILCGQGPGEQADESLRIAAILQERGIGHELDLWGPEAGRGPETWKAMLRKVYGAAPALA